MVLYSTYEIIHSETQHEASVWSYYYEKEIVNGNMFEPIKWTEKYWKY